MDLREVHKKKIAELILTKFQGAWAIIVFDPMAGEILNRLFKKSDLLDYRITWTFPIADAKRPNWKLPVIYFVNCSKEIALKINAEYENNKETPIHVFSLSQPVGLNRMINCTIVNLNLEAVEERVFKCSIDNLVSVSTILQGMFNIHYFECTEQLAKTIERKLNAKMDEYFRYNNTKDITLLVLDRTVDMFTPLMYFFTFRSIIKELDGLDCNDSYYPKIRDKHIGEVNDAINKTLKKLQETLAKIGSSNVDSLDKLILDAPNCIELKANVEKYFKYYNKAVSKYDMLKDIATTQQDLVIGKDMESNRVTVNLDTFMEKIISPKLAYEDRLGLLYLLKTKGIVFSQYEKELLVSKGFAKEDISIIFNQRNQVQRTKQRQTKFTISRYEPVILDVVEGFINRKQGFKQLGEAQEKIESLRRSTMMTVPKTTQRFLVVYVKNGLCEEELKLPYLITETFGIDCIFGSDKILTRSEFIKEYRNNKELHETAGRQ